MLVWWCYMDYCCSYESLCLTKGVLRWAFKSPSRQPVSVTLLFLTPTHTARLPLWGKDATHSHANISSDTAQLREEVLFNESRDEDRMLPKCLWWLIQIYTSLLSGKYFNYYAFLDSQINLLEMKLGFPHYMNECSLWNGKICLLTLKPTVWEESHSPVVMGRRKQAERAKCDP